MNMKTKLAIAFILAVFIPIIIGIIVDAATSFSVLWNNILRVFVGLLVSALFALISPRCSQGTSGASPKRGAPSPKGT